MEATVLVTKRQEKEFHRKASEFSLPVREEGSSCPAGKFYIITYDNGGELYALGTAIGFTEGLHTSHQPEKELLN